MAGVVAADDLTLVLLPGCDEVAPRGGCPARVGEHIQRLATRFPGEVGQVLVAHELAGDASALFAWRPIPRPVSGRDVLHQLQAALTVCTTPWLLTVPVDVIDLNDCLVRSLMAATGRGAGAVAATADGIQPRVALYRCAMLAPELVRSLELGEEDLSGMHARLGLSHVHLHGVRFGDRGVGSLLPLLPAR